MLIQYGQGGTVLLTMMNFCKKASTCLILNISSLEIFKWNLTLRKWQIFVTSDRELNLNKRTLPLTVYYFLWNLNVFWLLVWFSFLLCVTHYVPIPLTSKLIFFIFLPLNVTLSFHTSAYQKKKKKHLISLQ